MRGYERHVWRETSKDLYIWGLDIRGIVILIANLYIKSWLFFFIGVGILLAAFFLDHIFGITIATAFKRIKTMIKQFIFSKDIV